MRDLAASALSLSLLALFFAGARVALDSRAHFARGEALRARAEVSRSTRDWERAAEAYTASVESYVPFASHGRSALERVHQIAEELATRGHGQSARQVLVRAAAAARALDCVFSPYAEESARLEALTRPRAPALAAESQP